MSGRFGWSGRDLLVSGKLIARVEQTSSCRSCCESRSLASHAERRRARARLGDLGAVTREPVRVVNRPAGATPFCVFGGTAFMERVVRVPNAQRVCRRGGLPTPAGVWFGPR